MDETVNQELDGFVTWTDDLWASLQKMPVRKQVEYFAEVMGVSTKSATNYILRDWMELVGVSQIHDKLNAGNVHKA